MRVHPRDARGWLLLILERKGVSRPVRAGAGGRETREGVGMEHSPLVQLGRDFVTSIRRRAGARERWTGTPRWRAGNRRNFEPIGFSRLGLLKNGWIKGVRPQKGLSDSRGVVPRNEPLRLFGKLRKTLHARFYGEVAKPAWRSGLPDFGENLSGRRDVATTSCGAGSCLQIWRDRPFPQS